VDAFSSRLRDQVDLDTVAAELLGVVARTVQPELASLWLRPRQEPAGSRPQQPLDAVGDGQPDLGGLVLAELVARRAAHVEHVHHA
jgi:hypothetical protein